MRRAERAMKPMERWCQTLFLVLTCRLRNQKQSLTPRACFGSSRRTHARNSSQSRVGEILDPVLHIVRVEDFGNQLQIANGLANGNTELVRVHDARESRACLQAPMRDRQQILVLAEKNAAK